MTTLYQPGHNATESQSHADDAMTFLAEMERAGAAYAKAAGTEGQEYAAAESAALFSAVMGQAGLHAQLAVAAGCRDMAAAVRELTTEVDNMRRQLP
jgi:hypothetical protein